MAGVFIVTRGQSEVENLDLSFRREQMRLDERMQRIEDSCGSIDDRMRQCEQLCAEGDGKISTLLAAAMDD